MKTPLAGFIAVWLVSLTFGAAAPPCLAADFEISKFVGRPPTLNRKIGISVTIEPCDTGRYTYDYYYIDEDNGVVVLLEKGAECKDHDMSISLPENFLLNKPVYFQVAVTSEFSDHVFAKFDFRDCELGGEWVAAAHSFDQPYEFTPGWNLKCLPCATDTGTGTASEWLNDLRDQGVLATKIRRWTGSDWQTYTLGDASGNFGIGRGWGYFIYSESSGSWKRAYNTSGVCVYNLSCTGCWDVTFQDGWNLVGGYLFGQSTAQGLINRLREDGIKVDKIMRWTGSGWQTYTAGAPFGNFHLDYKSAYFIHKKP